MNVNRKMATKKGFTMVELSLSIAFIAVLSIIVVVVIAGAVSAYHRGLTLNQINTVGMSIVDDMRAAVQSSPGRSIAEECEAEKATNVTTCIKNRVNRVLTKSIVIGGKTANSVPIYGVFCTGRYSYLWNSGYFDNDDIDLGDLEKLSLVISSGDDEEEEEGQTWSDFKLLKVNDGKRSVCTMAANAFRTGSDRDSKIDVSSDSGVNSPVEIISQNSSLALYDLMVPVPAESGNSDNMLYMVSFILGTVQGGINVKSSGNFCKTPSDTSGLENLDYCAINKFNFAAQATGG